MAEAGCRGTGLLGAEAGPRRSRAKTGPEPKTNMSVASVWRRVCETFHRDQEARFYGIRNLD